MTSERRAFPLAKMSPLFRHISTIVLALPIVFTTAAFGAPSPVRWLLLGLGALFISLSVGVWLYFRPSRFEMGPDALSIVWPMRRQKIPRTEIVGARVTEWTGFRRQFGWAVRIGVGGLWGAFGLLWTNRAGFVEVYVSRFDRWVLIERRQARPVIITPEPVDDFMSLLGQPR